MIRSWQHAVGRAIILGNERPVGFGFNSAIRVGGNVLEVWNTKCRKKTKKTVDFIYTRYINSHLWSMILVSFPLGIRYWNAEPILRWFEALEMIKLETGRPFYVCDIHIDIWANYYIHYIPPKFNSEFTLKNGGWKTTFLLGFGNFSGAMVNFGRVIPKPEPRTFMWGIPLLFTTIWGDLGCHYNLPRIYYTP